MNTDQKLIQNNHFVPKPYDDYFLDMRNKVSQKHDVIVAILDTGVDPSAFGLTSCPDGSKKVIDVIDCTGSDDVIVKLVTPLDVSEYLENIYSHTGLIITNTDQQDFVSIYNELNNCKFYKGCRSLRSFVSKRLYDTFDKKQQVIIDSIVLNVVVYKNSTNNPICIVDYDGESKNYILVDEYHISQKYGQIPIGNNLFMTFGFHLYDSLESISENELICSIVFDTGSHATHVAGIVGGCFPDEQMNGVNPHCKILSLKIGDSRVDGMETSIALIRALHEIVKHNCHIANYSYGEPAAGDKGRFIEMLNEYTFKHNILFITSAGNSGPNINTIGAPGVMTDRTLNVGAYTNSDYLTSIYNTYTDNLTDNNKSLFTEGVYEWSSRGPSMDRGMGVSVIAAGCALTSYPRWYKSNIKMCNGTSMASPNAAGFMSLVLSQFDQPSNYPHVYWLLRYAESTCKTVSDKNLEHFSQGHGLIGQISTNIDTYFNCKPCTYYYDVSIDNDSTKKGIVTFTKDNFGSVINDHMIDFKICSLPNDYCKDFKLNEAIHPLTMTNPDMGINNFSFVSHADMKPIRVSIDTNSYSGYIKFYEVVDFPESENKIMRYVKSIAVNQYNYSTINVSNDKKYNVVLKPGKIRRIYLNPEGNTLSIKLLGDIQNKVSVDVIQHYAGKGYDKRSSSKTFIGRITGSITGNQQNAILTTNVIPNVPTEICVYTSWTSSSVENVNVNVICEHKDVTLDKYLYELSEKIPITIKQYGSQSNNNTFKAKIKLEQIVTKYQPFKAEISNIDSRYVDKDGKAMKSLKLSYKINNHPNCTYYINTNDRVYDSKVHMSGCISGFYNDRKVFFANYVPKKVSNVVDHVVIEFMDSDENILKECINTVLTASRLPSTTIETECTFKTGFTLVDSPTKDVAKLNNVYDGDYLQFDILNTSFMVMYKKQLALTNINNSVKDVNINNDKSINKLMTDFTLVKNFVNKAINYNHNVTVEPIIMFDNTNKSNNANNTNNTNNTMQYENFLDMSIEERNKHEYVETLMFEIDSASIDNDSNRFKKKLKTTHKHFSDQKLLKTPPYNVIDLVHNIVEKPKSLSDIDNKMTIVSSIENNMSYWNNCTTNDVDVLRTAIVNDVSSNESYANANASLEDKKQLSGYKRKCYLMLNSNERVF